MENLTDDQFEILRTLASIYRSGCKSEFVVAASFTDTSLVYPDHESVVVNAEASDFEQLAAEELITLGHTSQGSLRGKLTARGLALTEPAHDAAPGPQSARAIKRVFIGHGRAAVWRELKDFLVERLELEYEEFNREPAAGLATKERLEEMLERADFALLVLTGEDDQADGTVRARENVVHEVGLFQGKLGFRRAIVLLEDGCREFSNIHGLTHIAFPKSRISAVFEEIRRVIEREKTVANTEAGAAASLHSTSAAVGDRPVRASKRAYAFAVAILRSLCGRTWFGNNLPGTLWDGKDPHWDRLAQLLVDVDDVRGRFKPYVEPDFFDGTDEPKVVASRRILGVYVGGADNFARFDEVRREFDLPDPTKVRALLKELE